MTAKKKVRKTVARAAGRESGAASRGRRILVVDDHPIMRQGLASLINSEPDLNVCCEAENVADALSLVERDTPDIVITDISLPGRNGLELIKDLQAVRPEMPVLALSMHDETLYAERVLRAGGRGYVMKQEGGLKLIEAIRRVLDGQIHVSEKMSSRILEIFSGKRGQSSKSPMERLTDREFEVFELLGQGLGTREVAGRLNLSVKTIEVHRGNIKQKLGAKSAPDLVRQAVRWVEMEQG